MRFGQLLEGLLRKKPTDTGQETPEGIRTQIAAIDKDIQGIGMFQNTVDSTGATRAADAQRLNDLRAIKANLEAKIPSKPQGAEVPKPIPVVAREKQPSEPVSTTRIPQESKGTA